MRSDGLSTVLSALLADRRVVAATLVDVGSGFLLDACTRDDGLADLELLGAAHADLARAGAALAPGGGDGAGLVVETGDGRVHVLREIPDPHGDRIVLAAVVRGSARVVARVRQRLAEVPVEALTAGPTLQRRPVDGRWDLTPAAPVAPAVPPEGLPGLDPVLPTRKTSTPIGDDGAGWAPKPEPAPWAAAMTPPTVVPDDGPAPDDPDTDPGTGPTSGPAEMLTRP